ncbi:MAG: hypothetical protein ACXQTN_00370 [Methanoculleaceae archaeon]
MECPVCGRDCIKDAREIIGLLPHIFAPCPECSRKVRNKLRPPADRTVPPVCTCCGKRLIDDVFAHCWLIMVEEGILRETDPLKAVGQPLVHPGFAMERLPYLPEDSLVLLSTGIERSTADRLYNEVPEIRGVIRSTGSIPGITDLDLDGMPDIYELLAGCDVRANVFHTRKEPLVIYKQQSLLHIEFPRLYNPKIACVDHEVMVHHPRVFVDACAGPGTLGLLAGLLGVPHLILNDIWWAAAYWSGVNVHVNRAHLGVGDVKWFRRYQEMRDRPVVREPVKVAEGRGERTIEVYQGDLFALREVLPEDVDLTVIDLFEKEDVERVNAILTRWRDLVGGDVFIP